MDKKVEIFNEFAGKIGRALMRTTGDETAHVHFYIKGKSDHIILIYLEETLTRIVAKGKECDEGECTRWTRSEFSDFSPQETLIRFIDQIEQVIIDHPGFQRSWSSLDEFLDWLTEMVS